MLHDNYQRHSQKLGPLSPHQDKVRLVTFGSPDGQRYHFAYDVAQRLLCLVDYPVRPMTEHN